MEEFLELGAKVLIVARSADALDALTSKLSVRHADAVQVVASDVSTEEGRAAVVSKVQSLWDGVLDILVNCVGTNKRARMEDAADEDYLEMVRTNQDSAYFMCKRCLPLLRASKSVRVCRLKKSRHLVPAHSSVPALRELSIHGLSADARSPAWSICRASLPSARRAPASRTP